MGADPNSNGIGIGIGIGNGNEDKAPVVLGLQPSALVDYVAKVDWSLLNLISGEKGGSIPVIISS